MSDSPNILIVSARFYTDIAEQLERGAEAALTAAGAQYTMVTVPGALEIPPAIAFTLAESTAQPYDGFVALGCVIRGETSHYDIVANESARGLMHLALTHHVPIGNGILTVDSHAQAAVRADPDIRNKGGDAVAACLRLIELRTAVP